MTDDVTDIQVVLRSKGVIHSRLNLVIVPSQFGIDDIIRVARQIGRREERSNFFGNRIDTCIRNDIPGEGLTGRAKGWIRTTQWIDDACVWQQRREVRAQEGWCRY